MEAKSTLKQPSSKKSTRSNNYLQTKFNIQSMSCIPDVSGLYYGELRQRIEEVQQHSDSLLNSATKLFTKIYRTKKKIDTHTQARITGREISSFDKDGEHDEIIEDLERNPRKHLQRIFLSSQIIKSLKNPDIEQRRQLMMQLAVPIGLGYFDGNGIKLLVNYYRSYQNKLHNEFMGAIERLWASTPDHSKTPEYKNIQRNKNLLHSLQNRPIYRIQTVDFIRTLVSKTIKDAINGTSNVPTGSTLASIKEQLEHNLIKVLMALIDVDFMHPELIRISETLLIPLNPDSPMPFFVQGCIWMNQVQIASIYEEFSPKAKPMINNRLQKCLAAYGMALKYLPAIQKKRQLYQKILTEHAQVCLYAYRLRKKLNIPNTVYKKFVTTGYKSLKQSGLKPQLDTKGLYEQYKKVFKTEEINPNDEKKEPAKKPSPPTK